MIRKIVSNGRIGVARGALDAALALDIPHGGCMLPGDPTLDGPLPDKYRLQEIKTGSLTKCVERNVKDTDGTLILTFSDDWSDDALCARKSADKYHTPWLQVNLGRTGEFEAAQSIHEWVKERKIEAVHVVGASRGPSQKNVDNITTGLLEAVYYLGLIENNMQATTRTDDPDRETPPKSVDEFISRISAGMTLKDRVIVANLQEPQLELLQPTLGRYILVQLEHWQESPMNVFSLPGLEEGLADAEEAAATVMKRLWTSLRDTHRLRMIK
jgi:hypothetical protein